MSVVSKHMKVNTWSLTNSNERAEGSGVVHAGTVEHATIDARRPSRHTVSQPVQLPTPRLAASRGFRLGGALYDGTATKGPHQCSVVCCDNNEVMAGPRGLADPISASF